MEKDFLNISEAANFLNVSKSTLRNWDNEGKLKVRRHPMNDYRVYEIKELKKLKASIFYEKNIGIQSVNSDNSSLKEIKKVISKMHNVLRDFDGDSSLIERFDELTKLLFLHIFEDSFFSNLERFEPSKIKEKYLEITKKFPELFPSRFSTINSSDEVLLECSKILSSFKIDHSFDIKGLCYEEVIKGTFDKNDNQQFFTPSPIVKFMLGCVEDYTEGIVLDPACGTAGFLVSLPKNNTKKIIGLEIDERLKWVSSINLLMHGAKNFHVDCEKSYGSFSTEYDYLNGSIDLIITNPPFGSDLTSDEVLSKYKLGKSFNSRRRGILFIERCFKFLKPNGILAIVIDESVLNSKSCVDVRDFILNNFNILSVISLPESAFLPYASVKTSILILQKCNVPQNNKLTFFANSESVGRKLNGDEDLIYKADGSFELNSDLDSILKNMKEFFKNGDIATSNKIFCRNIFEKLKSDETKRLDFKYNHPYKDLNKKLIDESAYKVYKISEICTEKAISVTPSVDLCNQEILYTGLANIDSFTGRASQVLTQSNSIKSSVKYYEKGDVIFSKMRPELRKVVNIEFDNPGYVSSECTVFQVNVKIISPKLFSIILRSNLVFNQIDHKISGIGRPRISIKDLRDVVIPIPPLEIQNQLEKEFDTAQENALILEEKAKDILKQAEQMKLESVENLAINFIGKSFE